jgi:hypothetical protein
MCKTRVLKKKHQNAQQAIPISDHTSWPEKHYYVLDYVDVTSASSVAHHCSSHLPLICTLWHLPLQSPAQNALEHSFIHVFAALRTCSNHVGTAAPTPFEMANACCDAVHGRCRLACWCQLSED